jgi:hypothetical protein
VFDVRIGVAGFVEEPRGADRYHDLVDFVEAVPLLQLLFGVVGGEPNVVASGCAPISSVRSLAQLDDLPDAVAVLLALVPPAAPPPLRGSFSLFAGLAQAISREKLAAGPARVWSRVTPCLRNSSATGTDYVRLPFLLLSLFARVPVASADAAPGLPNHLHLIIRLFFLLEHLWSALKAHLVRILGQLLLREGRNKIGQEHLEACTRLAFEDISVPAREALYFSNRADLLKVLQGMAADVPIISPAPEADEDGSQGGVGSERDDGDVTGGEREGRDEEEEEGHGRVE